MSIQRQQNGCYRETPSPPISEVPGNTDESFSPPEKYKYQGEVPLIHRWKSQYSIMCLAVWNNYIFAGTEKGEILVYDLISYQLKHRLHGHKGSVYTLVLAENRNYLISGSADSLVKVWCLHHFAEIYSIYSVYDIGDVFSLAWAAESQTVYLGAQNASIQWVHLSKSLATKDQSGLPSVRFNKFFDSSGPNGVQHVSQTKSTGPMKMSLIQVPRHNILRYAHNGFVYAMLALNHQEHHELLVSGAGDGTIKIWKTHHSQEDRVLAEIAGDQSMPTLLKSFEFDGEVMSLCSSTDNSMAYAGLADGQVVVIDLDTLQVLKVDQPEGTTQGVMTLSYTQGWVFKGIGNSIQKWHLNTYQRCNIEAHQGLVLACCISTWNNQTRLLTGGNDSTIALWDINNACFGGSNGCQTNQDRILGGITGLDDESMIKTLQKFVSYQTVSSNKRLSIDQCRKCAAYLRSLLRHFGAEATLLSVEPDLNPIVYAKFAAGNSETAESCNILFYGHYDVIEADNTDKWNTDPFILTAQNGYLYGRGASDNKGPVMAAIFAVAELFQGGKLQNNVIFLIEGEEECGSQGFESTVAKYRDLIGDIDWILLSNSYWINDTTPCLNYGLRGTVNMKLQISSGRPDLHSGVHGGVFREPTFDMVTLLSRLTPGGYIIIPHFYDSVRELDAGEEEWYDAIVKTPGISESKETLMKMWRYPSLTIHGLSVSGPGNSTVIPASVTAQLSFRLVPDQNIKDIETYSREFLEEIFSDMSTNNQLDISFSNQALPWLGDPNNSAFKVLRQAVKEQWGVEPLLIREGGSIPVVRALEQVFNAPAAQIPCGQASDGAHLNNERLRVTNLSALRHVLRTAFTKIEKNQQ